MKPRTRGFQTSWNSVWRVLLIRSDSGNRSVGANGSVDIRVEVSDDTGPRITVADIPESGWFSGDANFTFTVEDNCASPENMDVVIEPEHQMSFETETNSKCNTIAMHATICELPSPMRVAM